MASNECKHDIRITEFIKAKESGIDLSQSTDFFNKQLFRYTQFTPNNINDRSFSKEANYRANVPIVYFLHVMLFDYIPMVIYIGQSINGGDRPLQHWWNDIPFDGWLYIEPIYSMLDNVEEYYIRTCKPVLNLIKNPLYMRNDREYLISKQNFHYYREELIQHIRQVTALTKRGIEPSGLINRDNNSPTFNLIPKELERKYF